MSNECVGLEGRCCFGDGGWMRRKTKYPNDEKCRCYYNDDSSALFPLIGQDSKSSTDASYNTGNFCFGFRHSGFFRHWVFRHSSLPSHSSAPDRDPSYNGRLMADPLPSLPATACPLWNYCLAVYTPEKAFHEVPLLQSES